MDELERRVPALEGLLMERLALDSQAQIAALVDQVRQWPDEESKAQALQIIDDAVHRFDEFTQGIVLNPERKRGPDG